MAKTAPKTAPKTIDLTAVQAGTAVRAREVLTAARAPDWQDYQVKNLAHLEVALEEMLALVSELTGGNW